MKLIDFPGLNCCTNSVVTVAASLGIDYVSAFASLWSESDFRYDPFHKVFCSVRFFANLSLLGAKMCLLSDGSAVLAERERAVIGMDSFHIPWSPRFRKFTGPHYFIAEKSGAEFLCHDPTYRRKREVMSDDYMADHATNILAIRKDKSAELRIDDNAELQAVFEGTPKMSQRLNELLELCVSDSHKAEKAAQYADCLMNNRYLYRHYLKLRAPTSLAGNPLGSDEFFAGWNAVKHGLHKAAMTANCEAVIREVSEQASDLLRLESQAARAIQRSVFRTEG